MKNAIPIADRFWPKVLKSETCWMWMGARQPRGYGLIAAGGRGGAALLAHRVSYELHYGPIPPGMEIDHKCRITPCVNPEHLEPVLHAHNVQRGDGMGRGHRNRVKTHCPRGHEYAPANTIVNVLGHRQCRTCANDSRRAKYQAAVEAKHTGI